LDHGHIIIVIYKFQSENIHIMYLESLVIR